MKIWCPSRCAPDMNEFCCFLCGFGKKSSKIFPLNEIVANNMVCLSEYADMTSYFLQDIMYTLNIIYMLENNKKQNKLSLSSFSIEHNSKKSVEYYVNQLQHILYQYKYYCLSFSDRKDAVYVLTFHTYNTQNQMKALFEGLLNEFEILYDAYDKYVQHIREIFENYDKRYTHKILYLFQNNMIIIDKKLMKLKDIQRMVGMG